GERFAIQRPFDLAREDHEVLRLPRISVIGKRRAVCAAVRFGSDLNRPVRIVEGRRHLDAIEWRRAGQDSPPVHGGPLGMTFRLDYGPKRAERRELDEWRAVVEGAH